MPSSGLSIAREALPQQRIKYGPWLGSMRSRTADLVPREYLAESDAANPSSDFLYLPRTGHWRRRNGQVQKFDSFASPVGMLPAKWGAKCRQLEEFKSEAMTDGVPTLAALLTRETVAAGLDDGRFSTFWLRDQVANSNYTLGSEFDASVYPAPGSTQSYKVVPVWYDSGDGQMTRGIAEFQRRFFVGGSRKFLKVGNWVYFPNLYGTPCRWRGTIAGTASVNRLIPSGPLPPLHAGTLAAADLIEVSSSFFRPDGDISAGNWTKSTGGGTNLYTMIDEVPLLTESLLDSDYIQTPSDTVQTVCEVTLENPGLIPDADAVVKYRWRADISSGLTVELMQGAVSKATLPTNRTRVGGSTLGFIWNEGTLSAAQIASITDWNDLRLRFTKFQIGGGNQDAKVSYAALEIDTRTQRLEGGWRGSDKFYYSVAYRFEDDSIWMPCVPRGPNAILPNGYNLFTVDIGSPTSGYRKVVWSNVPIGPFGTKSRILLRSPKIDASSDSTLQLDPFDLQEIWEIKDNVTTTYDDYYADDDSLTLDVDALRIRIDHLMPPRARHIFGGDSRVCVSYGGLNPCAIILAPVGRSADYDLNLGDDVAALFANPSSYFQVSSTALILGRDTGAAFDVATSLAFSTYDTLEKLVDAINATSFAVNGKQWRAQMAPGANPQALTATHLAVTTRAITSCVVAGQAITKAAGGLSKVAVGSFVDPAGTGVTAGAYISAIVSDTQLTFVGTITAGTKTLTFVPGTGDTPFGQTQYAGWQRVIAGSLPGFIYFNRTYLDQFPIEKSSIWMTVATPGAVKSAANCFSAKGTNKHTPPLEAGISMGGAAIDNGFVVPFANRSAVIRNTRDFGTGLDSDYHLFLRAEGRGCCAWQSIAGGHRFVIFFTPQGLVASDLEQEMVLTDDIWDGASRGDFAYEAPLCIAAAGADTDGAYLSARILRDVIWINYRSSGTFPNRQVVYDFSTGIEASGLRALKRDATHLWGWSLPLTRAVTALAEGRRTDGSHLYGWNEQNAGLTGDGRIDEIETGNDDNGVAIGARATTPWERAGASSLISAQEITLEHSSPTGPTVALDFHRSYSEDLYTLTPSTSSSLVVTRDVKLLPLAARVGTAACYVGFRQSAGAASELRAIELRLKKLPSFK